MYNISQHLSSFDVLLFIDFPIQGQKSRQTHDKPVTLANMTGTKCMKSTPIPFTLSEVKDMKIKFMSKCSLH